MSSSLVVSSHAAEARSSLVALARELARLEARLSALESQMRESLDGAYPARRESARNLVHYVALRQSDLRDLQTRLSQRGLSSLGRSESCVLASVIEVSERAQESLLRRGNRGARRELSRLEQVRRTAVSWETAQRRLHDHSRDLFGPRPADRHVYIMVTAPDAREADCAWMTKMLRAGMNVLRINCAHEGEREWGQMARALDDARRATGKSEDVRALHDQLDRLGRSELGVVLKIETRAAVENLPRLLLEGLRRPSLAIMIARGDLAVEVGFERLAEVQEEILWMCEASHVPAIWATQVLDAMARTGVPSRAEVTDAAAGVAAECVMLNKGPFVDEAVTVLSDILRRMEMHHYKKRSLYRQLKIASFGEADGRAAAPRHRSIAAEPRTNVAQGPFDSSALAGPQRP